MDGLTEILPAVLDRDVGAIFFVALLVLLVTQAMLLVAHPPAA